MRGWEDGSIRMLVASRFLQLFISWPTFLSLTFHHHQLYLALCVSSVVCQLALVLPRMVEMDFGEFHFYGVFRFAFRYLKPKMAAFFGLMLLSPCCDIEIEKLMSGCTFLLFPFQLSRETFFPFYLLKIQMPRQDDSAINSCILPFQAWILKT